MCFVRCSTPCYRLPEAGNVSQKILFQAVSAGLVGVPIGAFEDLRVATVLRPPPTPSGVLATPGNCLGHDRGSLLRDGGSLPLNHQEKNDTATTIKAFDTTLQLTYAWLHELAEQMGTQDRHRAYHALWAVLHALRDRLTVEEVAALGAQLPLLVRGIYYEGWHPGNKPLKTRREDFLAAIRAGISR